MKYSLPRVAPLALACAAAMSPVFAVEVEPGLRSEAESNGSVGTLIVLQAKAPKQLLSPEGNYLERRRELVSMLRATAEVTQADLRNWLDAQGIAYRPFWIVNMVEADLTAAQIDALAARGDIARIEANREIALQRPALGPWPDASSDGASAHAPQAIEWGVNKVRAPLVWAEGFNGQGVVVAGQDTGIRWTHNAIKAKYRGWNGVSADHNYNWHDAIHETGSSCGANSPVPCDDHSHGSHTVGTMVGDDGGSNQVGVAPGAKWIGCRNMNAGVGTPARYNECAEWFLAPTDLNGQNPDPDRAPDVINNSWGCPADEGCTAGNEVRQAIENLVAGGIVFVASAGNDGSSCQTIFSQPGTLDAAFVVGSMTSSDTMSGFSSRGPVPGLGEVKPDVIAPGSSVRSITNSGDNSYTSMSGTSMAGPHVAGVVALMMSVDQSLKGDPARVEQILRETSVPISNSQVCGGIPGTTFPNPVQGMGRVDAYNAYLALDDIFADDFDD